MARALIHQFFARTKLIEVNPIRLIFKAACPGEYKRLSSGDRWKSKVYRCLNDNDFMTTQSR
jgi:hypothetical protein